MVPLPAHVRDLAPQPPGEPDGRAAADADQVRLLRQGRLRRDAVDELLRRLRTVGHGLVGAPEIGSHRRAVVVHEAPLTCGVGAEIAALVGERALLSLLAPVERVTGYDTIFPAAILEDHYLPTAERVIEAVRRTLEY